MKEGSVVTDVSVIPPGTLFLDEGGNYWTKCEDEVALKDWHRDLVKKNAGNWSVLTKRGTTHHKEGHTYQFTRKYGYKIVSLTIIKLPPPPESVELPEDGDWNVL